LGRIDAAFYNLALAREIVAHGNASLPRSQVAHYFDMVPPVGFDMTTPYNADGTLNVTAATSVAGVVPAAWQAASFKTGYGLTGSRVCGGYFRK
jgi:5-deoxy-D-glucuronate isomerase